PALKWGRRGEQGFFRTDGAHSHRGSPRVHQRQEEQGSGDPRHQPQDPSREKEEIRAAVNYWPLACIAFKSASRNDTGSAMTASCITRTFPRSNTSVTGICSGSPNFSCHCFPVETRRVSSFCFETSFVTASGPSSCTFMATTTV